MEGRRLNIKGGVEFTGLVSLKTTDADISSSID